MSNIQKVSDGEASQPSNAKRVSVANNNMMPRQPSSDYKQLEQ